MFGQTCKMAWSAVLANKMRTFLTMLGIIIGVSALVILVSIANGATSSISDTISSIGSSFLTVQVTDDKDNPIRLSEFYDLLDDETIENAAPMSMSSATAKSGYTEGTIMLYGTSGGYFDIMGLELSSGRLLKRTDLDNSSYVIVISSDTAVEIFGNSNVVGESISLDGKQFEVVGVTASDDLQSTSLMSLGDDDESVSLVGYIPYSTLVRMSGNSQYITQFYVSSASKESMDDTTKALEDIMLERLGDDEDAFSITDQSQVMDALSDVSTTMSLMLGGIAAISLLVGGIGIMNIMLVSVTERTKEIGIRKAIGATRFNIMAQFLMESVFVCVAGCLIGIGFSWVVIRIISAAMGDSMNMGMNGAVVLAAVIFSGVLGVVFGLYPANKAAGKKPIEALRYTD